MNFATWLTYALLMTAIAYTPGPMTLFSMSSSLRNGFARTVPALAGGSTAYMVQMAVVYFGLGVVVQNSLVVFNAIKWAGVVYLIVLGVKNWRAAVRTLQEDDSARAASRRRQFSLGFLTGMSNPKSVLVFTVLFPQFIDPARYTSDFLTLAVTFAVLQLSSAVSYALFGARVFTWLHRRGLAHVQNRITAVVLFLAGGMLAVSER
ncbi:LysE family translocator [Pseudodesulfovibrio cashew]|uniref:LysE family translocator n=1 Tax=Pseudodesulfovibrio cashew TaxID=2678688 RepID=A0A6I6JHH1_9BACT|nr:LysE family translocator [Pseudodesulfovibrio cashew]QGY39923.1 LysE family translocator [Pseudodesulfovibrio cashew]